MTGDTLTITGDLIGASGRHCPSRIEFGGSTWTLTSATPVPRGGSQMVAYTNIEDSTLWVILDE